MKLLKLSVILFSFILIAQSCRKDSDEFTSTPTVVEPTLVFQGSLFGTVVDENGSPVSEATVTLDNAQANTNEEGVFQFIDVDLYSNGNFVTVQKEGYFLGSRKFYGSTDNKAIVAVELIPLIEIDQFSNVSGGLVTFEEVVLDFPPNSISNNEGSSYTGNVHVAAKYLDPTLSRTINQMPGDLTGTTIDNDPVSLTSMAMISVELWGDSGEKLQVQDGFLINAKIPVPASLINAAPPTIPMWHFDEELGTWQEEGEAIFNNGIYEANLPHFSFWNCDVPGEMIFLKGQIVNRGIPIQGVNVIITQANAGTSAGTITDENGFFCGFVPKGQDLTLTVLDQCGNIIYELDIPASDVDITLDPINLLISENVSTVTGSVVLCDGTPSPETYVSVSNGSYTSIIIVNEDLTFTSNIFTCIGGELRIIAIDPINDLASESMYFPIEDEVIVGEIELCTEITALIDSRDGEEYEIVVIGDQIWTAQNMRYDTDDNIPDGLDIDHPLSGNYGRLYNLNSALEACPTGWHLPTYEEYEVLIDNTGGTFEAHDNLKSQNGWINDGNGNNSSGFNALPTGTLSVNTGTISFLGQGVQTGFWTSDAQEGNEVNGILLTGLSAGVGSFGGTVVHGNPIRCVKD